MFFDSQQPNETVEKPFGRLAIGRTTAQPVWVGHNRVSAGGSAILGGATVPQKRRFFRYYAPVRTISIVHPPWILSAM